MARTDGTRAAQAVISLIALTLAGVSQLGAFQDPPVVFKSDVSLVRVDVQVTDRTNRAVSSLRKEDFQIRDQGQVREIVNFSREDLPLDVLLLLDVSGSMRPHVELIANAAHEALGQLGNQDRVALMVFDRSTRLSMPFKTNHDEIMRGFQMLLDRENFNGGTDITRGMLDAIDYMKSHARRGTRRAIVILTDDMTERERDEFRVGRALENANTVMSALIAPDAMGNRSGFPGGGGYPGGGGGGYPGGRRGGNSGGGWPGGNGGGGLGGLGGIIFGPNTGGIGGRRMPGQIPGNVGGRLKSAGTAEIARASGGDSMAADDASALDTTLERIRQSYALYFNAPEGAREGEQRSVEVSLLGAAARRFPDAELRYRQTYSVTEGGTTSGTSDVNDRPTVTHRNTSGGYDEPAVKTTKNTDDDSGAPKMKRRPAVNEPGSDSGPGFRKVKTADEGSVSAPAEEKPTLNTTAKKPDTPAPASTDAADTQSSGGFRRLKPGEKP